MGDFEWFIIDTNNRKSKVIYKFYATEQEAEIELKKLKSYKRPNEYVICKKIIK